jgi:hypothetical protein
MHEQKCFAIDFMDHGDEFHETYTHYVVADGFESALQLSTTVRTLLSNPRSYVSNIRLLFDINEIQQYEAQK